MLNKVDLGSRLDEAAAAGLLAPEQVGPLNEFLARGVVAPQSAVTATIPGEEDLRFVRNFHDVFLATGTSEPGSIGYTFDYVSDAQLQSSLAENGQIRTPGALYRVIVVPATRRMPVATLQKLAALAASGAKIIFEKLPEDVPGFGRLAERRAEFKTTLTTLTPQATVNADILNAVAPHARREALADHGLSFIRRTSAPGAHSEIAILSSRSS